MSYEYERTHPFVSFSFNLGPISRSAWIQMGRAEELCDSLASIPLRPDTADRLHKLYLAKGVRGSAAIEGNTLTEEQVDAILDREFVPRPSQAYMAKEVENIVEACSAVWNHIQRSKSDSLSPDIIRDWHRLVLEGTEYGEGAVPGEFRSGSVGVLGYRAVPWNDVPVLMSRLCEWLNGGDFRGSQPSRFALALLRAVIAHVYLAWIHPFGDGNGRIARLVEFHILLAAGVPSPAAHILSNHYNQTRSMYYKHLDSASRSGGDIVPFIEYAVEGFVDGLRSQLELVRDQVFDIVWRNYIHENSGDNASGKRRRELALAISRYVFSEKKPVPYDGVALVSQKVSALYAGMTSRTVARDINGLLDNGVIKKVEGGYADRRFEVLRQFVPPHIEQDQDNGGS